MASLDHLSEDVLLKCMEFLGVKDLTAGMCVSSSWRSLCSFDELWVELCRERWKNKQNFKLTPAKERRLNRTKHVTPWRKLYAMAELDSKRTRITVEELCSMRWVFSDGLQYPIFHPNHLLEMELYPLMHWSFNTDHTLQIQSFPAHNFFRHADDWSWIIRNQNISMYSLETPWTEDDDAPTPSEAEPESESAEPADSTVSTASASGSVALSVATEHDGDSEMSATSVCGPSPSPSGSPTRKRRLSKRGSGPSPTHLLAKRHKDSEDLKATPKVTPEQDLPKESAEQRLARRTARLQSMPRPPVNVAGYGLVPHHVLISMLRDIQRQQINFDDSEIPHWLRGPGSSGAVTARPSTAPAPPTADDDADAAPEPDVALPASLSAPFAAITLAPEVTANLRLVHSQAQAQVRRTERKQPQRDRERKSEARAPRSTPWPSSADAHEAPRPSPSSSASAGPSSQSASASRPVSVWEISHDIAWEGKERPPAPTSSASQSVSPLNRKSPSRSAPPAAAAAAPRSQTAPAVALSPVINLAEVVLARHLPSYLDSAPAPVIPTGGAGGFDVSLPPSVSSVLPAIATAIMPVNATGTRSAVTQHTGAGSAPDLVNSAMVSLFAPASSTPSPLDSQPQPQQQTGTRR